MNSSRRRHALPFMGGLVLGFIVLLMSSLVFAQTLPAKIEAEDYKSGGEGTGYHDLTSGNSGGEYRTDDVDITTCTDTGGGYCVTNIWEGEWLAYDVSVPSSGDYTFTFRLKCGATQPIYVMMGETNVTGMFYVYTAGAWADHVVEDVSLTAGSHVMTVVFDSSGNWNGQDCLNYIDITSETPPTVAFTASSQSPSEGAGTVTVTAELSASTGSTVTVPFTLSGTATETTDYSITSSPITITAGQTTGTATITITDDSLDENDETVIVTMGTLTNATQGATTVHTATITDNDATPTVTFTAASQSPGEGAGTATVTAQLSAASGLTVTVPYTLGGTATESTDYTISASPITITAGQTTGTATITITDDALDENDETVIVTMGTPTNATQGATTVHTATITDNDATPTVSFTSASQSVGEGAGAATVTAQLSAASGLTVTIPFTLGGTATETTDYSITSSPITISAGQTTGTATVTIVDDTSTESSETVVVTMGTPTNATQGATTVHTATITDNDSANTAPTVDVCPDQAVNVSNSVTLDATVTDDDLPDPPDSVTTTWTKQSGPGTVTFGSTSAVSTTATFDTVGTYVLRLTADDSVLTDHDELTVVVVEDSVNILPAKIEAEDYNEGGQGVGYYDLTSGNSGGEYRSDDVDITTCNDSGGGYCVTNIWEGEWLAYDVYVPQSGDYTITVRLKAGASQPVYVMMDETNVTGMFYVYTAGVWDDHPVEDVSLTAGSHVMTVVFDSSGNWNGQDAVNYVEIMSSGSSTPTVTFTSASQSQGEGAGTATVTAQLSAASGQTVTVPFTLGGTATETTDYSITSSPITITAGQTTGTATITIVDDSLDEADETVIVTMGTPTNATQGATTVHTLTITDNDAAPTVTFTSASQSQGEGVGTATVTAQLSAASGLTVMVPFTLGGTATETTDYSITSSPITISAGQTTGTATITIVDDTAVESSETVVVTMGTPTNASQGATTVHTLTITDNDSGGGNTAPTVDVGPDQAVNVSNSVTLGATVTDDDLPDPPDSVTTTWTKQSGPGTVTFGNTGSVSTTATFDTVGTYVLRLTADDSALTDYDELTVVVVADSVNVIPGKIEAEDYMEGGQDVAYYDTTSGNTGGVYRSDDVDIYSCSDTGGGYCVGYFDDNEWLSYDVYISRAGHYKFTVRATSLLTSRKVSFQVDGEDAGDWIGFGPTYVAPAPEAYADVVIDGVYLPAGSHVLTLNIDYMGHWTDKINYFEVETSQDGPAVDAGPDWEITLPAFVTLDATVTDNGLPNPPGEFTTCWSVLSRPFGGTAVFEDRFDVDTTVVFDSAGTYVLRLTADDSLAKSHDDVTVVVNDVTTRINLPGRLEAEDYADQGEGVSYHDTTSGNAGSVYRSDDVDIESCGDTGGGYDVYTIAADEWLSFDVNVPADTACYDIVARVNSSTSSRQMHVEVDGEDVTGPMTFDSTGGWANVTAEGVHLTAGRHTIRVVMDTGDFALNYVDVLAETYEEYIVEDGVANADIVISSSPCTTVTLAANKLQEVIEDMTGATLPIVTTPTGADVHIYVGQSSYTDTLGISTSGLESDAFKMVSGSNWMALIGADTECDPVEPRIDSEANWEVWDEITGSTYMIPLNEIGRQYNWSVGVWRADGHGSLMAVFEFLRDLGWRWYYPDTIGECLPDLDDIGLPTVNRTVEPDYPVRRMFIYNREFIFCSEAEILWQWSIGLNEGEDVMGWTVGHGIGYVIAREEMKTAHPEYYALINGVRQTVGWKGEGWPCMSSTGLMAENVNFVEKVFDHYDEPMISIMPTDGYSMCQCELCDGKETLNRGLNGRYSDYCSAYTNAVAEEVYLTHPNHKVSIDAYANFFLAPLEIEQFSPNVVLGFCHESMALYGDDDYQSCMENLNKWLTLLPSQQFRVDDYYIYSGNYGNPAYFLHLIKNDWRMFKGEALGTFTEVAGTDTDLQLSWDAYATNHLNIYLTARMLWDADLDLEALLEEYYEKFYGPAAEEMKTFVEYSEANFMDFDTDSSVLTTERSLLNAAITAASGSGVYADRVDLVDEFLKLAEE